MKKDLTKDKEVKEKINNYEKKQKRDRLQKIILIIIILIILLLHFFLCERIGKIGFGDVQTVSDNIENSKDGIIDVIEIKNGDINSIKSEILDIFKNEKFNGEKIIAPGSYGTYTFYVKNQTGENIIYDITFLDEMTNLVNMKYKLKIDNIYVRGNQDEYVSISDLDLKNIIVVEDSVNMFTLEWYWEDSDIQDTYVGSQKEKQTYTLDIEVKASMYLD